MTDPTQITLDDFAALSDEAVRRIMDTEEPSRDLRLRFERFHRDNPGVYQGLVRLARQAKASGHARIGVSLCWEVLRWESLVGQTNGREEYRLDNGYRAFYARLIMAQESDLAEFFETRRGTWNQ